MSERMVVQKGEVMRISGAKDKNILSTTQHLGDVARAYLSALEERMQGRSLDILEAWPQVAGEFARMTRAQKFDQGVLFISVRNSTVLSLLQLKKTSLLSALRDKVPGAQVLSIVFRIG